MPHVDWDDDEVRIPPLPIDPSNSAESRKRKKREQERKQREEELRKRKPATTGNDTQQCKKPSCSDPAFKNYHKCKLPIHGNPTVAAGAANHWIPWGASEISRRSPNQASTTACKGVDGTPQNGSICSVVVTFAKYSNPDGSGYGIDS